MIPSALDQLTDELEKYRLAEIEKETLGADKRKFLSPEEIKAAKLYLSSPNLMERTKLGHRRGNQPLTHVPDLHQSEDEQPLAHHQPRQQWRRQDPPARKSRPTDPRRRPDRDHQAQHQCLLLLRQATA